MEEFFENVPPGPSVIVKEAAQLDKDDGLLRFKLPWLRLHCDIVVCEGVRFFTATATDPERFYHDRQNQFFVTYRCRNCLVSSKTYAFAATLGKGSSGKVTAVKFGEIPPFGPPTPARVITLIGPEKDYFLKGRRSENQGLGIAAFAYYRRVVESQKNRILDEIIRVSEKLNAPAEVLAGLQKAKDETQFSKAIEAIKHGIPQALLINGHNPLTLLHSALSEGLHDQPDEHCLELATSIRVVLTELAERLGTALKDNAELNAGLPSVQEGDRERRLAVSSGRAILTTRRRAWLRQPHRAPPRSPRVGPSLPHFGGGILARPIPDIQV